MQEQLPPSHASEELEKEPESTRVFFTSVFSWFDKATKYKRFRKTRRYIKEGKNLFDLSGEELSKLDAMGPWTFKMYETFLAALPSQILGAVLNFFMPYEPSPQTTGQLSQYQEAFIRNYYKFAPSVDNFIRPGLIPLMLLAVSSIIAWGCLRKEHSTRQSRKRCRNAHLYFDGTYGFIPQIIGTLLLTVLILCYQRGLHSIIVYLLLIILFNVVSIWLLNVTLGTEAVRLFRLNGYATCLPSMMESTDIPAPRAKYFLSFVFIVVPVSYLLLLTYVLVEVLIVIALVMFRLWLRGPI
jgi:hypothetical protein